MTITAPKAGRSAASAPAWRTEERGSVVLVRRRGDAEPAPADWADRLAAVLQRHPDVAVAGAKRLDEAGRIASMGEMVIHAKGLHALGRGVDGEAFRFPEEVDAIAGGAAAIGADRLARDGRRERLLADCTGLGLLELCLDLRREGGRVVTVPDVTVVDPAHPDPSPDARAAFERRFGFDLLAADLDEVRRLHAGTGLLWNVRLHGAALPFEKYRRRGSMHWQAYEQVQTYRQRADHLAGLLARLTPEGAALDLGCGDGLFAHLLASRGVTVIGADIEPEALAEAERAVRSRTYPGPAPIFADASGDAMPWPDNRFRTIAMLDVIEHLPNPVRVLRECERLLAPGGHLLISTPAWQFGHWSDPVYHLCEYTMEELIAQVTAATGLEIRDTGRIGGVYRDLVVIARRPEIAQTPAVA